MSGNDAGAKAEGAINANPQLANSPVTLAAFMGVPNVSGEHLGAASHFMTAYGQLVDLARTAVQSDNPKARAWWQTALHDGANIWDHVRHATASVADLANSTVTSESTYKDLGRMATEAFVTEPERFINTVRTNPGEIGQKTMADLNAAGESVKSLFTSIVSPYNPYSPQFFGNQPNAVNSFMQGYQSGGLGSALSSAGKQSLTRLNAINPVNPQAYSQMAHAGAMFISTAQQKGLDYALAQWAPIIATSIATHSFIAGGETAAGVVPEFAKLQEEMDAAQAEANAAAREARLSQRGPTFRAASSAARLITSPLKAFSRVSSTLMKPGADLRLNMMYAMAHAAFSNNPDTAKMWAATSNGLVVNADGQPIQTVGQGLMQALGAEPNDPLSKLAGGATTIYAQAFGSDPFGAAGSLIGRARSAEGLGGVLGNLFGGTLVKSASDVFRVYDQYGQAQQAVRFIATHNSGEILREFSGWFKGASGLKFLGALARAKTDEEVLQVFADAAEAGTLARPTMPMMSMYKVGMAAFKDTEFARGVSRGAFEAVGKKYFSDMMAADSRLINLMADGIKNNSDFRVADQGSNVYAAGVGTEAANVRLRASFGQWLGRQLGAKGWMIGRGLSVEGHILDLMDKNTGIMLAKNIRECGMPGEIADSVQELWVNATPAQRSTIIDNINFHLLARTVLAGMPESVYSHLGSAIEQLIREAIPEQSGAAKAGETGSTVSGDMDRSYGESGKARAIDSTQLAQRFLIDPATAKRTALTIRDLVLKATKEINGALGVDGSLAHLDEQSLLRIAETRKATLGDVQSRVESLKATLEEGVTATERQNAVALHKAYINERDLLVQDLKDLLASSKRDEIGTSEAYVKFYTTVRDDYQKLRILTELGNEALKAKRELANEPEMYRQAIAELDSRLPAGTPFRTIADLDKATHTQLLGEREALADVLANLNSHLEDTTLEDYASHVQSMREAEQKLSKEEAEKLAKDYADHRAKNNLRTNPWHVINEAANWWISKVWSPAALTNAGWAMRVATSEALLNTFRVGARDALKSKILTSYMKHEMGGGYFSKGLESLLEDKVLRGRILGGTFHDMIRNPELTIPAKITGSFVRGLVGIILEARDLAGGTLHGIESNLINFTPRTERMIQNFVEAFADFDGHLPMEIHGGAQIIDNQILTYGNDANGKPMLGHGAHGADYSNISAGASYYPEALRRGVNGLFVGPEMSVAHRAQVEVLVKRGAEGLTTAQQEELGLEGLIKRGASTVKTNKDLEDLRTEILPTIQKHLAEMDPGKKELFEAVREDGKISKSAEEIYAQLPKDEQQRFLQLSPEERQNYVREWNWADNLAYHVTSTVSGTGEGGRVVMHPDLIEEGYTGNLGSSRDYKAKVEQMERDGHTAPKNISGPTKGEGKWYDALIRASDVMHGRVLGPIVNAMVRDPLYLLEFDRKMEELYQANKLSMSRDEMKLLAYQSAMEEMVKYVHNPLDKQIFEARTRALFPFWFAQNQAWRRALRVLGNDPGAFWKLMKTYTLLTNTVSRISSGGNLPILTMPSGTMPSWLPGLSNSYNDINPIGKLDFSLGADFSNINSIVPTGASAGMGILENIIRPSGGPVITLTADALKVMTNWITGEVDSIANTSRGEYWNEKIQNAINAGIGSAATYDTQTGLSGLENELFPSSQVRNIVRAGVAITGNWRTASGNFDSVQIAVAKNAMDNLASKYYPQYYEQDIKAGASPTNAQIYATNMSLRTVQALLDPATNSKFAANFWASVHAASATMYTWKTFVNLGSPFTVTIQDTFSKEPEYQKLLDEKLPDGNPKYTATEALNLYTEKYPTHAFDIIAQTINASPAQESQGVVGPSFSVTQHTQQWIQNNFQLMSDAPLASAIYSYSTGKYSGAAAAFEKQNQLRTSLTTPEFATRTLQILGDDFLYNDLLAQFPDTSYQNYKIRTKILNTYMHIENPIFGAYYGSGEDGKKAVDNATADEVIKTAGTFVNGAFVPVSEYGDSAFGGRQQREQFAYIAYAYKSALADYSANKGTAAYDIEQSWYNNCTAEMNAKNKDGSPVYSPQVQKFLEILRTMPGK